VKNPVADYKSLSLMGLNTRAQVVASGCEGPWEHLPILLTGVTCSNQMTDQLDDKITLGFKAKTFFLKPTRFNWKLYKLYCRFLSRFNYSI